MTKKITPAQDAIIIKALVEGKTNRQAGKLAGLSKDYANKLKPQADLIKKEAKAKMKDTEVKDIVDFTKSLVRIMNDCGKALTPEKIKNASPAAIATIMGISTDKMQLLTGGVTENINHTFSDKSKAVNYLKDKLKSKTAKPEGGKSLKNKEKPSNISTK